MKRYVHRHRVKPYLTHKGLIVRANAFEAFKAYIQMYENTHFTDVFKLLKNVCGVYRFNSNGQTLYIGYSENLQERICVSYFNHCVGYGNITIQLILCEDIKQALDNEIYYIQQIKPTWNIMRVNEQISITTDILQFNAPININNDFFMRFCD